MIICGLDLATKTGVAVGPVGGVPDLWTVDLKSKGEAAYHGDRFLRVQDLAHRLIRDYKVEAFAIEKPFVAAHNNFETTMLSMGLPSCVGAWATRKGVPFKLFPAQTVTKSLIGTGKLKRADKKAAVIAECRARGWDAQDDNQADAAAVWHYGCIVFSPAYAAQSAPLFARERGQA